MELWFPAVMEALKLLRPGSWSNVVKLRSCSVLLSDSFETFCLFFSFFFVFCWWKVLFLSPGSHKPLRGNLDYLLSSSKLRLITVASRVPVLNCLVAFLFRVVSESYFKGMLWIVSCVIQFSVWYPWMPSFWFFLGFYVEKCESFSRFLKIAMPLLDWLILEKLVKGGPDEIGFCSLNLVRDQYLGRWIFEFF